jgi:hypothetical protein
MTIHDIKQLSDEWFAIKALNPFSSSQATAIGSQGKGLETLVWESIAGKYSLGKVETFSTKHTERGNELEPLARQTYELITGNKTKEVGFITNDKYKLAGASTDSLVGKDGVLEIKCFEDKKHFKYILEEKKTGTFTIESGYEWQCQMELLITEREWVDFAIYNPNYPEELLIKRVFPDPIKQQKLITGIAIGVKLYKELEEEYLK